MEASSPSGMDTTKGENAAELVLIRGACGRSDERDAMSAAAACFVGHFCIFICFLISYVRVRFYFVFVFVVRSCIYVPVFVSSYLCAYSYSYSFFGFAFAFCIRILVSESQPSRGVWAEKPS